MGQQLALIFHFGASSFAFLCGLNTIGNLLDFKSCQRSSEGFVEVKAVTVVDISPFRVFGEDFEFATRQRLEYTLQFWQNDARTSLQFL